jgi:peptidoglycan/LPS O-acetylase OafA/YrhL
MPSSVPIFRNDINGLRAWAVVAVIGFHFGITGFAGGFVGVDIFFVLSGFLMAGIVVSGAEKSGQSVLASISFLAGFYLARARRIVPALAVVCGAILIVGWFTLSSGEYQGVAKNVVSALAFLSNFRFSREAGYFDESAHEKVLLHTWSLSVEWQFYLLFPILVLVLLRLNVSRRRLVAILALLAFASLVLSISTSLTMPARAFFLLPWRAWELLAGALVWFLSRSPVLPAKLRFCCEAAGFALILGCVFLLNENAIWPGWLAMLPVMGTAMILIASRQDSIMTAGPVAQWLGRSSYSLYLWHWPIVVALFYLELQNDVVAIGTGLVLTGIFGWLSYRWVETPSRVRLARWPRPVELGVILAGILAVIIPSQIVRTLNGVPGRLPPDVEVIFNEARLSNPRMMECQGNPKTPVRECTYGGPKLGVIVMGDSHAGAVVRAVERALPDAGLHVLDWTKAECPTIADIKKVGGEVFSCGEFVRRAIEKSKTLPDAPIVLLNRTSNETDPGEAPAAPRYYFDTPPTSLDAAFYRKHPRRYCLDGVRTRARSARLLRPPHPGDACKRPESDGPRSYSRPNR